MKYFILSALLTVSMAVAGQHMFDYQDIRNGRFAQRGVYGVRSMKDGELYTALEGNAIAKYSYKTGQKISEIFNASAHAQLSGELSDYSLSSDETKILLALDREKIYRRSGYAQHWVYDIASNHIVKLTCEGREQVPVFTPDGREVVFVRDNNIFVISVGDANERQVTSDGEKNRVINGHGDWVYEEEFTLTRAFQISPSGDRIAYLRFDETDVPEVSIQRYTGSLNPKPLTFKYPKAGERNSIVTLWLYNIKDGSRIKVDTGSETDQYIPRIGWTPEEELYFYRINRQQNYFELLLTDSQGKARVVYDEKDSRYIERTDDETITFLPKSDRFVVKNETIGYTHLYLYSASKGVIDTITRGNWDVTKLVDITGDRVYYVSNEGSPLRNNLYSVKINGKGKKRLTSDEGTYKILPGAQFKYFITTLSNVTTPELVRLHNANGEILRILEDNIEVKKMAEERNLPRKEFFRFSNGYGAMLNGYMIKPYDFSTDKKYPVLMVQYSGPGSQMVMDRWWVDWTDVLVQEGYIVVCVDGRGTGGRGANFKKCTYKNLGYLETVDQISAAKYIATQPYVDADRIGIYGWSYGGFMALNCMLNGDDIFKTAIAVAPVTSWRYYDTVYTELYNGLPESNPRGYDNNSPVNFAGNLKGKLLLIHGSGDDNVHVINSLAMAEALIKADKRFDMMIYPDDDHSMLPVGKNHIMELMIDYLLKNL